jgi:hypothetical protein
MADASRDGLTQTTEQWNGPSRDRNSIFDARCRLSHRTDIFREETFRPGRRTELINLRLKKTAMMKLIITETAE